jgi:hypothetical protein
MFDRLRSRLRTGWRALRRGADLDRELARELEAHVEDQIAENLAQGMRPDEARRTARQQFGSRVAIEEECRETRGVAFVDNLARDVR